MRQLYVNRPTNGKTNWKQHAYLRFILTYPQTPLLQKRQDLLTKILQIGLEIIKAQLYAINPNLMQFRNLIDDLLRTPNDLDISAKIQALLVTRIFAASPRMRVAVVGCRIRVAECLLGIVARLAVEDGLRVGFGFLGGVLGDDDGVDDGFNCAVGFLRGVLDGRDVCRQRLERGINVRAAGRRDEDQIRVLDSKLNPRRGSRCIDEYWPSVGWFRSYPGVV